MNNASFYKGTLMDERNRGCKEVYYCTYLHIHRIFNPVEKKAGAKGVSIRQKVALSIEEAISTESSILKLY